MDKMEEGIRSRKKGLRDRRIDPRGIAKEKGGELISSPFAGRRRPPDLYLLRLIIIVRMIIPKK